MTQRALFTRVALVASIALAAGFGLAGCSKSKPPPAPTLESLQESTPTPPQGALRRFTAALGSKVRIEGTANMIHTHWAVQGNLIGGLLDVSTNFPTQPGQAVQPGKVQAQAEAFIPVRSLKSVEDDGKPYSDKMDDIMYEKLLAQEHPKIFYRLKELVLKEAPASHDLPYVFDSKGELVVAGVTNAISMPVNVLPLGDNRLKLSGNVPVKMTQFNIEPPAPKLLAGMLKTGDEVKLFFEWMVRQKPPTPAAAKP